jgi:hypothetical protein
MHFTGIDIKFFNFVWNCEKNSIRNTRLLQLRNVSKIDSKHFRIKLLDIRIVAVNSSLPFFSRIHHYFNISRIIEVNVSLR